MADAAPSNSGWFRERLCWCVNFLTAPPQDETGEDGRTGQRGEGDTDVTRPQKLYGLYNQGATCYLNSVLQVLFMTPEIHDRLDPEQELGKIFEGLKKETCSTENITRSLEIRNVHEQRDAAECLETVLDKIGPQASEFFQGELRYTTKCCKSHIICEAQSPFSSLPLSLKDSDDTTCDVESSFERFFHTKTYNMVHCNDCGDKTEVTKRCEMVKPPQILTLLLKRFDLDYSTMSHVKSNCRVDVPRTLQIQKRKYALYGMVNHMGSRHGGHYTATILSNQDKSWYEFDDTRVTKVKEQPFAETGTHNSRTAYLLMYRDTLSQLPSETNWRTSIIQSPIVQVFCKVPTLIITLYNLHIENPHLNMF